MITKLTTSALLVLLTSSAFAADLPSRAVLPVVPALAPFNWTGLYVGAQVGYEFGRDQRAVVTNATGASLSGTSSPKNVLGGGHLGYNYAMPSLVPFGTATIVGVEGDIASSSSQKAYTLTPITASYREQIQGSARGRLGIAFDRTLIFATAGGAFGGIRNAYFRGATTDFATSKRVGYTLGAGVEYALAKNWSLRLEYRYTDFGTYTNLLQATSGSALSVRHRDDDNRIQAGVTYHFHAFAPNALVARY